jgi:exopolysaccharide biosynthesis polyprenyl glycosylphosphotransferase
MIAPQMVKWLGGAMRQRKPSDGRRGRDRHARTRSPGAGGAALRRQPRQWQWQRRRRDGYRAGGLPGRRVASPPACRVASQPACRVASQPGRQPARSPARPPRASSESGAEYFALKEAAESHMRTKQTPARNNSLKILVVAVDLALVNISYVIGFFIRFWGQPPTFNFRPYIVAIPFLSLTALAYIDAFGMLRFFRESRRAIIAAIFKVVFMQALTTTTITYFLGGFSFPRSVLLYAPLIQIILLTAWNWAMLELRDAFTPEASALLVGDRHSADAVLEKLAASRIGRRMAVRHVLAPADRDAVMGLIPSVDEVILCSQLAEELKMEVLLECANSRKVAYLVPEVFEISLPRCRVVNFDDMPLFMLDRLNLSFEQRFFKRAFDLAVSAVALPALLPFLAAIVAAIKLTSPGRAFYSQERMTAGGRVYQIYKLRTMREGAEAETGPVISSAGDSRVTKVGRFLRKYHIDELPQLVNVLKGDMSLVGPRSERPYFAERFSRDIEGYSIRNNVKAGLTGYAQIFGHYGTLPEYKLKYDILYIKNYSLLLDIKLLFQTINTVLKKGG